MKYKPKSIDEHRQDMLSAVEHKIEALVRNGSRKTFGLKFEERSHLDEDVLEKLLIWKENLKCS